MNNELIKITKDVQGNSVVSGRDLHDFLEVQTKYLDWFNRMIEYGFTENIDFSTINELSQKKEGSRFVKRNIVNHAITLDMAKEISMIQRTEKGKQARQYFIEVEKAFKEQYRLPQTPEEKLALTMEVTTRLNKRIGKIEEDLDDIKNKQEIDSTQRYKLKKARNKKAVEVLSGKESDAYQDKSLTRKVFRTLERDLKDSFTISRYENLRRDEFDSAIKFIENWYPPYPLKREISLKNSQMRIV
ncbi:ORF6C domain-containing protein [Ligilactobacillus salivarius]|uniref:ORF6C domain-containing protein n=1 Tax=Ligilactobacillus salivarius TaxID=1624 RepID=UPI001368F5E4|nr:ORF6C domain-containing protein [Ligilactobacillus salivarius]MYY55274.1 phage antirepressor Ant [Ligilactobacillus salivarius]